MKRLACPLIALMFAATTLVGCAPEATPEPTPEPTVEPTTEAPLSDDELLELAEERYLGYLRSLVTAINERDPSLEASSSWATSELIEAESPGIQAVIDEHLRVEGSPVVSNASLESRDELTVQIVTCTDRSAIVYIDQFGLDRPPVEADPLLASKITFEGAQVNTMLISSIEILGGSEQKVCTSSN